MGRMMDNWCGPKEKERRAKLAVAIAKKLVSFWGPKPLDSARHLLRLEQITGLSVAELRGDDRTLRAARTRQAAMIAAIMVTDRKRMNLETVAAFFYKTRGTLHWNVKYLAGYGRLPSDPREKALRALGREIMKEVANEKSQ